MTACLVLILLWTGLSDGHVPSCDEQTFSTIVLGTCLPNFNKSMEDTGYAHTCPWPAVRGVYTALNHCVDDGAVKTWCKNWGDLVNRVFLDLHHRYFSLCGVQIQKPPLITVVMLVAPSVIVTLLLPLLCVHLTTRNTDAAL